MLPYQQTFIELALSYKALCFGDFTLKSGRKSPYFFNMGQLNMGEALRKLGECYAQAIKQENMSFTVLFGPAYKGIPLVCTTAVAFSSLFEESIPYAFNRKEIKSHGEGGDIIGAPLHGEILILDDVITAGTAIRESLELIKKKSGRVSGILVALDRQERGETELSALDQLRKELNIPIKSLITFNDIIEFVGKEAAFNSFKQPLMEYREAYGV